MIINKVVINILLFFGRKHFRISKGLNIISAPNAGGKSQLFNAFYWTYFEQVYADNGVGKKEWRSAKNIIVCPDKLKVESNPNDVSLPQSK
jgi:hypothetical protein